MPATDEDCPECREQKLQAQAKAAATPDAEGLRLGACAESYQRWVDCIEQEKGQAKACAAVLKSFKEGREHQAQQKR